MPSQQLKRYEQILQGMINGVVARTDLSDLGDTSAFKHLLAATAREVDEAYYQLALMRDVFSIDTAVGDDLDLRAAEIQPSVLVRRAATKATGAVTFSRPGTIGTVAIPAGTVVKTADGKAFQTTSSGSIGAGDTSSLPVAAVAVEAGAAGNVAPGTVVRFDAKPAGVSSVSNLVSFANGTDKETDDEFRARIRSFIRTLSRATNEALEFVARSVSIDTGQRVVYAHVFEDPINRGEVTLYIDDGAGTAETVATVVGENVTAGLSGPPADTAVGGEEFLSLDNKPVKLGTPFTLTSSVRGALVDGTDYVLNDADARIYFTPALTAGEGITGGYTHYTGLIAEVQKVIDGDPNDRLNYPGWRAAGVRVRVRTPQILQQVVQASIVVRDGYTQAEVFAEITAAVSAYINGLGISGDVLRNEVIERIMAVPGCYNCTLLSPASDVIMLDDQLPRITSGNILLT